MIALVFKLSGKIYKSMALGDKKKEKLAETGFDAERYQELTGLLLSNWALASPVLKNRQAKQILDIIAGFHSKGWIKKPSDLKKAAETGSYIISIAQKHFGDREYDAAEVFNFDFLYPVVRDAGDWKLVVGMLKQAENPFDLLVVLKIKFF